MPAITAFDSIQPSLPQLQAPEQEKLLPLMAHFSSANLSCEELARPETPWLPQRMWNWLAKRGEPTPQAAQHNEPGDVCISLAEEEARSGRDEENPPSPLAGRVACAALSLLGVAAVGSLAYYRFARHDGESVPGALVPGADNETLPDMPLPAYLAAAPETTTRKQCLHHSLWIVGKSEKGPCEDEIQEIVEKQEKERQEKARKKAEKEKKKAEEEARKKAAEDARKKAEDAKKEKRCRFRSRWPGGGDTYGPCPESRKPVQSSKKKNKPKTTTTTETPPAEKIKYYMPVVQPAVCREFSTLQRCERVHPNYPRKDRLILQYNDKNCYCPPPEKKKSWYEIVYIADEKKHTTTPAPATTQPAKIEYYQKKEQPAVCQEKQVLQRCEKMHNAHPRVNSLLLPVASDTCYCPPPEAHKKNYDVIFIDDEITSTSSTTTQTTSTARPATTSARPTKKPFYTKKNQPAICKDINLLARCERVLANYPAATQQVLKSGSNDCYCPPPEKKRRQYDVIYLDVAVNKTEPPSTEAPEKVSVSLTVTIPAPVKRRERLSYLRLPDEGYDKLGRKIIPPEPEQPDVVKIEKMFDLDCIEARNSLSWTNIARVIGETLESPVTKLSEESAIVHSHNAGKGCPPPEELENMRAITSRIDSILSLILQSLPHALPIRVAQNIIGPGLQIFADDMEGIATPITRLTNFVQQLSQTARDLMPTLATPQKLSLYSKSGKDDGSAPLDKSTFLKRFAFRAGKTFISVGGKQYRLRRQEDETPYVIDEEGRFSYVQYNKDVDQWVFIEKENNFFYSDKNKAYAEVYGISLAEEAEGFTASVDYHNDFVTLTSPKKVDLTGVFVGNDFVPATLEKSGFNHVAFSKSPRMDQVRSMMKTHAGWVFDPPSTKMDEYLRLLLDSKPGGISLTRENLIAPINDLSKFSTSARLGNFIKHNDRFYKANLRSLQDTGDYYYEVEGFSEAKVKLKDDTLVLESETNMLYPLRTTVVPELFPRDQNFIIENGALNYLLQHASTIKTAAKSRFGPGIYSDKDGKYFFAAQNSRFTIKSFSEREVTIMGNAEKGHDKDIKLWSDGKTWYRVRDEGAITAVDYSDISVCRAKKSPGGSVGCTPVMVETDLHRQLQKHIIKGTTSKAPPVPENLVEANLFDIPFLYKDPVSKNHYFLYDDHYFDAKILEPEDKFNPTGSYGLTLSGKNSFFSRNEFIAHIIAEKKSDKIEIKTMAAYAAERLKTHKKIAINYINKRPWRDISEMNAIEDAVNTAQQSGDIHVEIGVELSGSPKSRLAFSAAWDEASKNLYPQRILQDKGYSFKLFPPGSTAEAYGSYEHKALQLCNEQMSYMHEKVVPTVIDALDFTTPGAADCIDYIGEVLQSRDSRFNNDVMLALRDRLEKIDDRLFFLKETDKIFLTTTVHEKAKITDPDRISSVLLPEEKGAGVAAMVPKNSDNYLFINIDKTEEIDFMSTLIYGAAQAYGMTQPLAGIERENGIYIPVKDAVKDLIDKLHQNGLTNAQFENLKSISKPYLEKVPAYHKVHIDDLLEQRKLAYLLKNDPGYKAHVLLHSSEFLALMTQDLYYQVSLKNAEGMPGRIDSWMKKYGDQRAFSNVKEKQPLRTDLSTEEVTETLFTAENFDGAGYLAEAQSVEEIKNGMEDPVRNSDAISSSVATFMTNKGFTDIRHRAMALFISRDDGTPATHFAVVGKLGGKEYVFDLSAGEFAERFAELDGPLILPEQKWAQKYALLSDSLLIKYADFDSLEDAQRRFSQFNKYLYWGPETKIPDARILRRPAWYFPETKQPELPALPGRLTDGRLGYTNRVREAARRSQLSAKTSGTSWNYAVKLLENANLMTQGAAAELRAEMLRAVDFSRTNAKTPGAVDDLLMNSRIIDDKEKFLRVKAGELLVFMAAKPEFSAKGAHPVHVMTSTGNGRFAGIQNSIIDASLDDSKMILTAEQLGDFVQGKFKCRGSTSLSEIELIAGYPKELKIDEYPTLRTLAEGTPVERYNGKFIAEQTTELLRVSGELSPGQSFALAEALIPLLYATRDVGKSTRSIQDLLYHADRIHNRADLATLPPGRLVIFGKPTSSYHASHVMYSLGYGEFVMFDPTYLDPRINSPVARVEAWQFPEEVIREHKVYAGAVALETLRVNSLLGPDAKFSVKNNVVKVTAHGAIVNAAFLDGPELADVIRGLGLRENPPVDWAKIEHVELNSCYSALGRLPLGKVIAYLLQKDVTAWPRLYSERMRNNPDIATHAKVFHPETVTPEELQLMKKQATRNYYFWSHLLRGWFYRIVDHVRKKRDPADWDNMFKNVFAVANGNVTVDSFFEAMPEYKEQMNTTPELFAEMIADPIEDAEDFAERCMDIFYLSRYTEKLVDEYLSQLD